MRTKRHGAQDALAAYKKSRPTSSIAEELTYNPVAATARELIPASTEDVLKEVADRLPLTTTYCTRMGDVIEHMVNRHVGTLRGTERRSGGRYCGTGRRSRGRDCGTGRPSGGRDCGTERRPGGRD